MSALGRPVLPPRAPAAVAAPKPRPPAIDGTVYVRERGSFRVLGGIVVELLDGRRKVVNRVQTAADGSYAVEAVPPGNYLLRVSPEQLKKLGLTDTGMRVIEVKPSGGTIHDVNLIVLADDIPSRSAPPARTPPAAAPKHEPPRAR